MLFSLLVRIVLHGLATRIALRPRHRHGAHKIALAFSQFRSTLAIMDSPNPVIAAITVAIEAKKRELAELEAALLKYQREANAGKQKKLRFRAKTGFRPGSIPQRIHEILKDKEGQAMTASELALELTARGEKVESKLIAASVARYIGKVFRRNEEGKYLLVS